MTAEHHITWPANIAIGHNTVITGPQTFQRFFSNLDPGLTIGDHSTMSEVRFAVGAKGQIHIGDYCCFTNAILLCEDELRIANYVVIGWNVTISDSDFHPLAPAERIQDAIACSPLGSKTNRPRFAIQPVTIDDDVFIGPGATILKGVHIHSGAWIEPGAVVLKDVPPGARVTGNPASIDPSGVEHG